MEFLSYFFEEKEGKCKSLAGVAELILSRDLMLSVICCERCFLDPRDCLECTNAFPSLMCKRYTHEQKVKGSVECRN